MSCLRVSESQSQADPKLHVWSRCKTDTRHLSAANKCDGSIIDDVLVVIVRPAPKTTGLHDSPRLAKWSFERVLETGSISPPTSVSGV